MQNRFLYCLQNKHFHQFGIWTRTSVDTPNLIQNQHNEEPKTNQPSCPGVTDKPNNNVKYTTELRIKLLPVVPIIQLEKPEIADNQKWKKLKKPTSN